jgi:hypothetical protein
MLKSIAATLVATTLIAGTAFAAEPSANSATTPAAAPAVSQSAPAAANGQTAAKPANAASTMTTKHTGKQVSHNAAPVAKPVVTQNGNSSS